MKHTPTPLVCVGLEINVRISYPYILRLSLFRCPNSHEKPTVANFPGRKTLGRTKFVIGDFDASGKGRYAYPRFTRCDIESIEDELVYRIPTSKDDDSYDDEDIPIVIDVKLDITSICDLGLTRSPSEFEQDILELEAKWRSAKNNTMTEEETGDQPDSSPTPSICVIPPGLTETAASPSCCPSKDTNLWEEGT